MAANMGFSQHPSHIGSDCPHKHLRNTCACLNSILSDIFFCLFFFRFNCAFWCFCRDTRRFLEDFVIWSDRFRQSDATVNRKSSRISHSVQKDVKAERREARLWAAFKQEAKPSNNSCFILHASREGLLLWSRSSFTSAVCMSTFGTHFRCRNLFFSLFPSHTHCSAPRCPAWALRPGSARFHHRGLEQRGFCETVSTTSLFNQQNHPIYIPLLHAVARPFSLVSCALLADTFQRVLTHN